MSNIPANQGAVKLSEVATDSAQVIANLPANTDSLSVFESLQQVTGDLLTRASMFLTSQFGYPSTSGGGSISWSGSTITLSGSTSIVLKLIQAGSGIATDLILTYGASNGETTFNTLPLSTGQILYIELDRGNLTGSTLTLHNAVSGGSVQAGETVKVATSLPAAINTNPSGSGPQGTIAIPLAINIAGNICWIPHGIFWPANTSSPLGAILTSTAMPLGAIVPYYTFTGASPYGYATVMTQAPGWALCDGAIVIDPNSPFANPTRNSDGTPNGSTNFSLDKFTPNLNGPPPTWSSAVTWNEGDYVNNAGTYYVAIQAVPTTIAITNTSYWIPESTYNSAITSNPYNKYRRTTQNRVGGANQNSVVQGAATSQDANTSGGYGGSVSASITLVPANLPAHVHSLSITTGTESAGHTHEYGYATTTTINGGGQTVLSSVVNNSQTTTGESASHTHSFTGNTGNGPGTDSAFTVATIPPFYQTPQIVRIY